MMTCRSGPTTVGLTNRFPWAEALKLPGPVGGGWDPCHLSRHIDGPLQPVRGNATLLRTGCAKHHAVLLLDSMVGWYRALASECKALPEVKGVSWHVDVVVKPAGWLGTYRKSAVTGLWFAGRQLYMCREHEAPERLCLHRLSGIRLNRRPRLECYISKSLPWRYLS
jgi:hypothetical protein